MVYLCSPYTHPDPAVRQRRFEGACHAAAELMRRGKTVFAPIAYSHPLCRYGLPLDWQFWERHDLQYLAMCDEVVVLKLDGWQQSRGVQAEIAAARALGKPVSFLEPCVQHAESAEGRRENASAGGIRPMALGLDRERLVP